MTDYKVGDKIKFDNYYWIVEKVDVEKGRIMLKGYGFRKWYKIDDVNRNAKLERMKIWG